MSRRLVMGTAGHIDHGKTALIKMLTGYDCDRLPEEQSRGITIELGFTHLTLPSGVVCGVVDVPGHERFVRSMVAGAGGIDFVLLVIAADEAVMPQTREHLAICRLLGLQRGLVALNKIDLVDEETMELAMEDVSDLLAETFLAESPIVPVSSVTGAGKEELLRAIDGVAKQVPERSTSDIFRLPVDRSFTMRGFGTVVTGTTVSGAVKVGDELEIMPSGIRTKVRGLQVHGQKVDQALAGQRSAVNLQTGSVQQAARGSLLTHPGVLEPTYMLDVDLQLEPDAPRPLKRRSQVRLHLFTREVLAHVVPLSHEQLEPGQSGKVQLRLRRPVVALPGDRFVVRSYSPISTVGGGVVLHSQPRKHRQPYDQALEDLRILHEGEVVERLAVHYRHAGRRGVVLSHLAPLLGVAEKALRDAYQLLLSRQLIVRVEKETELAVDGKALAEIQSDLIDVLTNFHRERPAETGLGRAELTDRIAKGAGNKVLSKALHNLINEGRVVKEGASVRLAEHTATAGEELQKTLENVLHMISQSGLSAPTYKVLLEKVGREKLLNQALAMLQREDKVVRVGNNLYYDAAEIARAKQALVDYLQRNEEIDAQGMKTLFGVSRKWSIPLAEYFDAAKVTLRVGDKRKLRRRE